MFNTKESLEKDFEIHKRKALASGRLKGKKVLPSKDLVIMNGKKSADWRKK